jgi:hypothetical protein
MCKSSEDRGAAASFGDGQLTPIALSLCLQCSCTAEARQQQCMLFHTIATPGSALPHKSQLQFAVLSCTRFLHRYYAIE